MRAWGWILLLVVLAALAAFGWHWVAVDPGLVLVRIRGWEATSTVLTALVLVVLAALILIGLWRLLRWPFGAVGRKSRRRSREQLNSGLIYLVEGHHAAAERALTRASHDRPQRGVALLAAARAAAAQGKRLVARELLDKAAGTLPLAARSERARLLRRGGKPGDAVALLAPHAEHDRLSPAGWLELARSALAASEPARARAALKALRESGSFDPAARDVLEARVMTASIEAVGNGSELKELWASLPKAPRRRPEVIDAYARRAAGFGQAMAAMSEIEAALNRQWSPRLVETWGALEDEEVEARLRRAERWLDKHPDDPALLSTLGRLSARLQVWGKAREYLNRALELHADAATWEALGEVYAGQDNVVLSQRCYRNALRMLRHEPVEPLPGVRAESAEASNETARDVHGLPYLSEGEGERRAPT